MHMSPLLPDLYTELFSCVASALDGADMASWREIDRIRKDPAAMRALAAHLMRLPNADLTKWEIKFLDSISGDRTGGEFTTRQSEKLLQIRDDSEYVSEIGHARLSVKILITDCQLGHLDLNEDNEEWILGFPKGTASIRRKDIGRLLRCARDLNNIDDEDAA
jgi:hypothetical protein